MQVRLIGKKAIYKITLPKNIIGNYWISDRSGEKEKKLISIEGRNGRWQVKSNNFIKILKPKYINIKENKIEEIDNGDRYIDKIILNEYDMYCVSLAGSNEVYILYCSPVYDEDFIHLDLKEHKDITIGSEDTCDIKYKNPFVSKKHAKIVSNNGRWILENYDKKLGTFVNDTPVYDTTRVLLNGDVIFIMGLKIILMGNSIYLNSSKSRISYNEKSFIQTYVKNYKSNLRMDEDEDSIYPEEKFYSRSPRIINKIERETLKIDAPPAAQGKEQMPAILMLGSTMIMGLIMVVSMTSSLGSMLGGQGVTGQAVLQLLMGIAMMLSMILFPILERKYEKKAKKQYEESRQKRYKAYIDTKIKDIDEAMHNQRKILFESYPSIDECSEIILSDSPRLWERKIENYDFLKLRLGTGDVPLEIDIQYPEKGFTMEDDNLVDILNTVGKKSKILKNAPLAMSFVENNVTGILSKNEEELKRYMKNLILQLVTFHSYEDLKLVFLLKDDKNKKWEHLKMLPHIWNNSKDIRFFTDEYDEMIEISNYLEEEFKERSSYQEVDYKVFSPYYLIITDDYKKIENLKIITEMLNLKRNIGFSFLCMADNLTLLPNQCKTFINIENGKGTIFESEMTADKQKEFTYDNTERLFFERISQKISNIPIKYNTSGITSLPSVYTFLQMYDVGSIEQLNILDRWTRNDPTLSLRAPVGIDGFGMPIVLDIHEKFHGPHGLIAGSTGSGKSEFIITYILSLAINYHPDDLNFVLIDYKGGGLAGAFKKGNIKLPHLVGTITNIDKVGLQRSLASIESELRRRQIMFNEARNMTDEGTIDIYKYQKLYHEGAVSEPIPHLLIICDEFAELKQQQPDFMDELISVARIGRSLGVHLILATQKPAGIVNDQIRSNSKFAVCLKVQDREDSNDVIKKPDAASLKNAGQFYLQVGNDEYFTLGQSAWSGAPYIPSDSSNKKPDTSIEFISNIGTLIKKVDDSVQKVEEEDQGEQLTNIVKYLYELAKKENIHANQLWLENIPETIYLEEIKEKYEETNQKDDIVLTIGEFDDPQNQRQGLVNLNISNGGNTLIYGSADSGKETLLSTVVYDAITSYSSKDLWLYLLDFGSETLKIFKDAPHVGDIAFMEDGEKIGRFFDMIQNEIQERKALLSDYNGDIKLYTNETGNILPNIIVVVNNYEAFSEFYDDKYDDALLSVTREGVKFGITFIMTVSAYNDVRYRLSQNFKEKIALKLNNDDDYFNILDNSSRIRPSNVFGRGLVNIDDITYEFQTAKICEAEDWNINIRDKIKQIKQNNEEIARPVPIMPHKITPEHVKNSFKDITTVPVGISRQSLKVETFDFTKELINIVSAKSIDVAVEFITHIIEEIKTLKGINLVLLDGERAIQVKRDDLEKSYTKLLMDLAQNKYDKTICIIIGLDKVINELKNGESDFEEILDISESIQNCNFIIVDNVTKLKNHEYDEWYKDHVSGETGIWVGNGMDNQYLIKLNSLGKNIVNNCGPSFGYVINQGEEKLIKLYGIKEEEEEDE